MKLKFVISDVSGSRGARSRVRLSAGLFTLLAAAASVSSSARAATTCDGHEYRDGAGDNGCALVSFTPDAGESDGGILTSGATLTYTTPTEEPADAAVTDTTNDVAPASCEVDAHDCPGPTCAYVLVARTNVLGATMACSMTCPGGETARVSYADYGKLRSDLDESCLLSCDAKGAGGRHGVVTSTDYVTCDNSTCTATFDARFGDPWESCASDGCTQGGRAVVQCPSADEDGAAPEPDSRPKPMITVSDDEGSCKDTLTCTGADCTVIPPLEVVAEWDERDWRCVDPITKAPTDARNPRPGMCGIVDADAEALWAKLAPANPPDDPWEAKDVDDHMSFEGMSLQGARFVGSFTLVNFRYADLRGADFTRASAPAADFGNTDLRRADFSGADLVGAKFASKAPSTSKANPTAASPLRAMTLIYKAKFARAKLDAVSFLGAGLSFVDFTGARGEGTVFDGAYLTGANFTGAAFPQASFVGAVISMNEGAISRGPLDSSGAFISAIFAGTDLRGADFRGAQMNPEHLTGEILKANFGQANLCTLPLETASLMVQSAQNVAGALYDLSGPLTDQPADRQQMIARVQRAMGMIPPADCRKHAPRSSLKQDLRAVKAMPLVDESNKPVGFWLYRRSYPIANARVPNEFYDQAAGPLCAKGDVPAERLIDDGMLLPATRLEKLWDGQYYQDFGALYLLRLGHVYVVYRAVRATWVTDGPAELPGGGTFPRCGTSGWESKYFEPVGTAAVSMGIPAIADAFYYNAAALSALEQEQRALTLAYGAVQLVPGASFLAIPMEHYFLGTEIFSTRNLARVTLDAAVIATGGAASIGKGYTATSQGLRLVAVGSATAGATLLVGDGAVAFSNGEYLRGTLDVGGTIISALIAGKNIRDFYTFAPIIAPTIRTPLAQVGPQPLVPLTIELPTSNVTVNFTRSPLKSSLKAADERSAQAFLPWMEGEAVVALADLSNGRSAADVLQKVASSRIAKQRRMNPDDRLVGAPTSGNLDPWGTFKTEIAASFTAEQAAARAQVGNMGLARLAEQGTPGLQGSLALTNMYKLRTGQVTGGAHISNWKSHPSHPNYVEGAWLQTRTSGSAAIREDSLARIEGLLAARRAGKTLKTDEAAREFATAVFGYYQAIPYARGGDAIGRVYFSALYRYLFNGKMPLPPLLDGYAYVKSHCEFVNWYGKLVLKNAGR